jgi:AraC-like DNA-binding protein
MGMPSLLWIDLRFYQSQLGLDRDLSRRYRLHRVNETAAIAKAIGQTSPQLLCFDFDYPDLPKLKTLQQTHRSHPALPILMLTEFHFEALAVWAFRTGVWDYLVKPVATDVLSLCIDLALKSERPPVSIPPEVRFYQPSPKKRLTLPAVAYIEAHYAEAIRLDDLSRLCGLGPFQFCRTFKQEQGVSLTRYLIHYRIDKAKALLNHPAASVTDVAFGVGFNDLSYFARVFRKAVGVSPSEYRLKTGAVIPLIQPAPSRGALLAARE